jgi:hypothetical protein
MSKKQQVANQGQDRDDDSDEFEFIPCSKCDGHPACEDFGCAYELKIGNVVKKGRPEAGNDDWN